MNQSFPAYRILETYVVDFGASLRYSSSVRRTNRYQPVPAEKPHFAISI